MYVERNELNEIVSAFAMKQDGMPEEFLLLDNPELQSFLNREA